MTISWLGVDTGGTFTDFVYFDGKSIKIHKVLSTPVAPEKAILQGIRDLQLEPSGLRLIHGSTVATNAVLEGKGVRTAYITNLGFADVLQIGRQARKELYNLQPETPRYLVAKDHCLEVDTRLSAQGELIKPLSDQALNQLTEKLQQLKPEAVAINLLFSFLDDRQEKQIAESIPEGIFISRSSDVLAEYKEYERGMATCLNAYVGPLMQGYLQRLEQAVEGAAVSVMQSAGGTMDASQAGHHAVRLLLSGPAGGLKGAQFVAGLSQYHQLLTFDMGGTSTDVALIDGDIGLTSEGHIGDYPVAVPMVDMHTIGAGGGSIAKVDAGGLLLVGPESAGADPGPACYGQGGCQATVTDANLVLGRLQPSAFLGGAMQLNADAAKNAIEIIANQLNTTIEQAAKGIIRVANEHMVRALRVISVQRGTDPREFSLVSFGGAGGLHVCALAEELQMESVCVPVQAGVLSALGMLVAAPSREMSRTVTKLIDDCSYEVLNKELNVLKQKALAEMKKELHEQSAEASYSVDLRYRGQSFTLNVPWLISSQKELIALQNEFHKKHKKRYGHAMEVAVELVNIRVSVSAKASSFSLLKLKYSNEKAQPVNQVQLYGIGNNINVFQKDQLLEGQEITGPALIVETVSTTYVAENWICNIDEWGNMLLSFGGDG
jgi:N-methylhydantoinase A